MATMVGCQGVSTSGQPGLSLLSASLDFGGVAPGSRKTLTVTATNSGTASITISAAAISSKYFSLTEPSLPVTLAAGQSTTIGVVFAPTASGAFSGTLAISSDAPNPLTSLALSGTCSATSSLGQLTVSPGSKSFGSVVVGNSGVASGTLSASGANITITGASTNNSAFSVGGLSLPVNIQAGESTSFSVTFSPQVSGAASATLTFTSDAQPATAVETLTGTGAAASNLAVKLSWEPSVSSNISGYNIYRAVYEKACGSFSKINAVLNTGTLYTDSTVVGATSYCYATTAVNTRHEESGYSNIISDLQIPAP
jgi:hypothetical protein